MSSQSSDTPPGSASLDEPLVRRLLAEQFPAYATLSLAPVASTGTDHAIFRLGEDMAVRLPKVEWAAAQAAKEQAWLPSLAPRLPLPVTVPVAAGRAGEGYPWPWSICRWLPGATVGLSDPVDDPGFAAELAGFVAALQALPTQGGPSPGAHNFGRGAPLASRDARTRAAIAELAGETDAAALLAIWTAALCAPAAQRPRWIHGDLQGGNLIAERGRLTGVIDFGGLGVGDPACDLIPAWNLFSRPARAAFRERLAPDAAAWTRGRGWALSTSAIWLQSYRDAKPADAPAFRRALADLLAEEA